MTALVLALVVPAVTAHAGESISPILNWTPAADHSSFYYAKPQGWFEKRTIT
jgi:NitT/TauT family transport system substrate-binding protein